MTIANANIFGSVTQASTFKTEGTSVTYGQDIRLQGEESTSGAATMAPQITANDLTSKGIAPSDTIVNVVESTEKVLQTACGFVITRVTPKTKSSIALAAASPLPNATVVIAKNETKFINPPPTTYQSIGYSPGREQLSIQNSITTALINNAAIVAPNVVKRAVVVGSEIKPKEEIKKILEEAQKVDLTISLKSNDSESLDFNTLKIPNTSFKLHYNFFEEGEEDIEKQEDIATDPLLKNKPINVPKYVRFDWTPARVTDPISGTELEAKKHEEFRIDNFFTPKGTATDGTLSLYKPRDMATISTPLLKDGLPQTLVDIHSPEEAFKSIANKAVFGNSVPMVVQENEDENVSVLPALEVLEMT